MVDFYNQAYDNYDNYAQKIIINNADQESYNSDL